MKLFSKYSIVENSRSYFGTDEQIKVLPFKCKVYREIITQIFLANGGMRNKNAMMEVFIVGKTYLASVKKLNSMFGNEGKP